MNIIEKTRSGIYIIAEMSANHNGELSRALEIAHAAKVSGADCLKIQTYTADAMTIDSDNEYFHIKGGLWDGYKLYDLYKEASTPYEWQEEIKRECDRLGIDFLSTPFDKNGADFLESLGVGAYKVASFELVDIPLIKHIAKKGKPMIISCGMGTVEEIYDAIQAATNEGLGNESIVLLKCTSEYPASFGNMNLSTIPDMYKRFGTTIGLSDHSMGSVAAIAAVALGARVIEKHFCISRGLGGVDSAFSMEPKEFKEMVDSVQGAFESRGNVEYGAIGKEKDSVVFRRSIFAVDDIKKGEVFSEGNIRTIRPGHGIKPKYYDDLIGKASKSDYAKGSPITEKEIYG